MNNRPNDGGFSEMMRSFDSFRSQFQGSPSAKLQEMLSSGQMSREQYNRLNQMANHLAGFLQRH